MPESKPKRIELRRSISQTAVAFMDMQFKADKVLQALNKLVPEGNVEYTIGNDGALIYRVPEAKMDAILKLLNKQESEPESYHSLPSVVWRAVMPNETIQETDYIMGGVLPHDEGQLVPHVGKLAINWPPNTFWRKVRL